MFYRALKTVYKILGVTVIGELKNVIHIVWCSLTEKLETLGDCLILASSKDIGLDRGSTDPKSR